MKSTICRVAVPLPVLQTFAYRVPDELTAAVRPGVRVRIPFGRRRLVGLVDEVTQDPERVTGPARSDPEPTSPEHTGPERTRDRLRPLLEVLDDAPLLPSRLLALCRWVADYYVAPPGVVHRTALPPSLLGRSRNARDPDLRRQVIRVARRLPSLVARDEAFGRAHRQRRAYEALEEMGGAAPVSHMDRQLGFGRSVLAGLVERGLAEIREEVVRRDPFAARTVLAGGNGRGSAAEADVGALGAAADRVTGSRVPTPAQADAIERLLGRTPMREPGVTLLWGVTGSGKTLVYLHLLDELVVRRSRGAIVLVPEIALTPQTVDRFRKRFPGLVAVLHSGLSDGERHDEWRALRDGRKRIAVGTRSAVFAPVRELGAIVLDEEHDSSYKQSDTPRYHARSVATVRARLERALCVLGSATPSLETWANAHDGRYQLLRLPERATAHPLPAVRIVDLRRGRAPGAPIDPGEAVRPADAAADAAEAAAPGRDVKPAGPPDAAGEAGPMDAAEATPGPVVLSAPLRAAIEMRLDRGEQTILLLNRRGYSTFLQCAACGHVWSCARCNVSLTYHRRRSRLVCHHCAYEAAVPPTCDRCGLDAVVFSGLGTEQAERRILEAFPSARIARMDVDTTGARWAHHEILERVRKREVDVLLGTQMIAKGLDFPGVTLVGVINADIGLNLPDFRASERTFQLLAQVAGRAGRGGVAGEVIVQTARPSHFALRTVVGHDFAAFAEQEIEDRRAPGYPPHRRLANLVVSGRSEERVAREAADLAAWTEAAIAERAQGAAGEPLLAGAHRGGSGGRRAVELLGPAPCPISRLRGRWRWHFLLKSDSAAELGLLLRLIASERGQPAGDLRLEIDRDPEALL